MEEKKPTHRVTIVTYDYQVTGGKAHVDRNFEVHARDTACAMIAAQLEVQRLNETTNAKWQILKVLEFGRTRRARQQSPLHLQRRPDTRG